MKRNLYNIFISIILIVFSNTSYAQTASRIVASNPQDQYKFIKKIVSDKIKSSGQGLYFSNGTKELDLYYCSDYSDMGASVGKENKSVSQLMSVAYDIGLYETSLAAVGYPRNIWGPFLRIREQSGLSGRELRYHNTNGDSKAEKRDLDRLASILNSYRDTGHRKLPKIIVDGGCGAGGTTVAFATRPPGGRVLLVPKMYYSLCRKQGIDPDDEKKCDFWREVFKGQTPEVSGDYFVKIVWENRSVIRSFSAYKLNNDSNMVTLQ